MQILSIHAIGAWLVAAPALAQESSPGPHDEFVGPAVPTSFPMPTREEVAFKLHVLFLVLAGVLTVFVGWKIWKSDSWDQRFKWMAIFVVSLALIAGIVYIGLPWLGLFGFSELDFVPEFSL